MDLDVLAAWQTTVRDLTRPSIRIDDLSRASWFNNRQSHSISRADQRQVVLSTGMGARHKSP